MSHAKYPSYPAYKPSVIDGYVKVFGSNGSYSTFNNLQLRDGLL